MRSADSDRAEMVSQLLFGEPYDIIQQTEKWVYIVSLNDNYHGWIDLGQHLTSIKSEKLETNFTVLAPLKFNTEKGEVALSIGSAVNTKNEQTYAGIISGEPILDAQKLVAIANQFLNTPYLWGGKTIWGADCSGFVQSVFKCAKINLPRDAYQQANVGQTVNFVEEVKPLDLAFFDNAAGKITHVGILLDSQTIIHASSFVRIDAFDQNGIFNKNLGKYTHNLRIIKRVLG